jgi:regulator of sigma E protease
VTTILAFVFVIGVLVFVHELGHFLAARRVGVRVLTFSIGFGPRIFGFTRGGTDYCISAVPLGGFVKMAGETTDSPDAPPTGKADEFLSKSKWERFQVLIMGPVMNLALAVIVLAFVLYQGADVPAYRDMPPIIGGIEKSSPADKAGLLQGDRILRVDDREVTTWDQLLVTIAGKARREVTLLVMRGGESRPIEVVPTAFGKYEVGDIGVYPNTHPHVRGVNPGDPAEKAGVKTGDVVMKVNDRTINFARQLSDEINKNVGKPTVVHVLRDGRPVDIHVTPIKRGAIGMIGIQIGDEVKKVEPGPLEAVKMSVEQNWENAGLIFRTLAGLFTGETSPKQLMGPVGIAQLSGESAQNGFVSLLGLMASISLNLGLLNLMPIPVLDGGHILILLLEGVSRRQFSNRVKERMLIAGFVLLMLLMVTVIYNDLARIQWVEHLMFWR